jgi:hypothetical protein
LNDNEVLATDRAAMLTITDGRTVIGFLLRTARGVRAFDRNGKELGDYGDEKEAADAVSAAAGEPAQ